ncbi:MAG: PfaB family protein [Saprospiraceae bacterium]|nr:PfaB family protein [Saprospiraceae bacterium]
MKIAIIGMSGLFPGSSTSKEFWNNLVGEKNLIEMANEEDFGVSPEVFYRPGKGIVDKCYSLRGGYIRNFEFDPSGYKLPEAFLAKQDKLYQWSLYVAKEALKHSGYYDSETALEKCGLILGNLSFPTGSSHKLLSDVYTQTTEKALQELLNDKNFKIEAHKYPRPENEVLCDTPSKMVSKALGLGGGHYALDAACATSLYAIKLACDELITGKSDLMLAGAVCASDQLFIHMGFSIFHAYAPHNQKFAPLDSNSGGLVSSEGAGIVVLKRLEDAQWDGDKILGVIGGIGLSNDGRGKFLLSPNPKGQKLAFERAYLLDDVLPQNTSYLECHATGTPLGDVTEMNSISEFFKQYNTAPLLGSVKSNMGHLLTAAGMTGLFKVLLSMEKGYIPPNVNLTEAVQTDNQFIKDEHIITRATPWKGKQAGINSFGFGGTNAHMVIQAYQKQKPIINKDIPLKAMSIVGMEAFFGDCVNLEEFYATIYNGKQHFRELPKSRWKGFEANEELLKAYNFTDGKAPKGAYIEDFEIDLLRYKIQPKEAETLESQQALILNVADKALKDSGVNEGQNIAVLIAMESELAIHHYLSRWDSVWQIQEALKNSKKTLNEENISLLEEVCKNALYFREGGQTPSQHTSFVGNIMASRIAALWDFSGPAFTVSCGQNSVFKALGIAQNMLSMGEVDAVVVGGVDFCGGLESVLLRNQKCNVNESDNPSLSINSKDNGWLIGEGAGAVVLKRAEDSEEDKVYATINHIGKGNEEFNVGYQEIVASGIPDEDNDEILQLLKIQHSEDVALGSVKCNIGNTFAASGIASLIKTALCIHHRFIPGIPNWHSPKFESEFAKSKYYFPKSSRPWLLHKGQQLRQAIVNGENGFQIQMTEAINYQKKETPLIHGRIGNIIPLKGNDEATLKQQIEALASAVNNNNTLSEIASFFYNQGQGKVTNYCISIVAKDKKSLKQELNFIKTNLHQAIQSGKALKTPKGSYFTPRPLGKEGKIAFVYPGSAAAYQGMGQDVFQLFPQLHTYFEERVPDMAEFVGTKYLYPKTQSDNSVKPNIHKDAIAMMTAGVFSSAIYTHILRSYFKLDPDMAFGYSMGESASMWYSNNIWSPQHTKVFRNSNLFQSELSGKLNLLAKVWKTTPEDAQNNWTSLILLAPKDKVEALISKYENVYITFINTENEIIISGNKINCNKVVTELNCNAVKVPFQNIIHHDFCKTAYDELIEMHNFPIEECPNIDFYSSIGLKKLPFESKTIAENSTEVCFKPVNFPRTCEYIYQEGARIFIELGANATCSNWISTNLKDKEHVAISMNKKGKTDSQSLVEVMAQLLSHGVDMDLKILYKNIKDQKHNRTFLKKIIPGGNRIFDVIVNNKNKEKFTPKSKVCSTKTLKPVLAMEEKYFVKSDEILDTEKQLAQEMISGFNEKNYSSILNKPLIVETKIVETSKIKNKRLGENGLILQDYETGEQLEGKNIVFTQADLEEFAKGKIGKVFGPEYNIIDDYKRRVMLPMEPYLLVSRVTDLNAKTGVFKPSSMQTEYDIPYNAWFTTDGQIPWAVSVESGQCDLMLISYLGIDFENKGELVYRLLDCTLTFVDDLPFEGQTLRYDISINSFVRNGDNLLFFFSYNCYIQDRLVLKMRGGCAGFFTDEQLEDGNGLVYSVDEIKAKKNVKQPKFTPLLKTSKTSFSIDDLRHLINGDIEKCFGNESYYADGKNKSLILAPEKILMIDRITSVDLTGGAYGLGYIVAEKDLHKDDWYFPCHFRDDEVLAGSLQAEGGGNLLRFFMLMLGLQRLTKDARYQPIYDLPQKVRCRKQVVPGKDTKLIYKLEIKEIGLVPNPYVIGDLEIISDGVITVHFENLGLQLREKKNPKYLEDESGIKIAPRSEGALLNEHDITTFALDNLSKCFGPDFACYDGRTVSRQPNTDLQLISRVLKIDGERLNFKKPATIYAEYDVPKDAWYYQQNNNNSMPYSVLMEIALQPCGLLGAYMGSTLKFSDKNLFFRNLDGSGEMFDLPNGTDFRGKTIHNKSILVSSVSLAGTVLQNYTFELTIDGQLFYKGKSSFGFFPEEALAQQVGLDNGKAIPAWYQTNNLDYKKYQPINLDSPYGKIKLFKAPENKPHYHLAGDQLQLLNNLKIVKDGGEYGKGYVHASKKIKTYDWFFTCHFYQDPVMPGSLGVEAILQAMQTFAIHQNLDKEFKNPKFVQLDNHETKWKYRGQILLGVENMHCEVHFKKIEKRSDKLAIIGDAYLWNEETRIYQITDLALGIEEA